MSGSEIARFRQQQAEEEQAAYNGLYGPAIVSSHDAILARMEQGAGPLLQLFEEGRDEEAFAMWNAGCLE